MFRYGGARQELKFILHQLYTFGLRSMVESAAPAPVVPPSPSSSICKSIYLHRAEILRKRVSPLFTGTGNLKPLRFRQPMLFALPASFCALKWRKRISVGWLAHCNNDLIRLLFVMKTCVNIAESNDGTTSHAHEWNGKPSKGLHSLAWRLFVVCISSRDEMIRTKRGHTNGSHHFPGAKLNNIHTTHKPAGNSQKTE